MAQQFLKRHERCRSFSEKRQAYKTQFKLDCRSFCKKLDLLEKVLSINPPLPQYVASLPPGAFGTVVNVAKLQQMVEVVAGSGEALAAVTVYGFLTRFDLDSSDAVSLRCGRCGGALTAVGEETVCAAFDCRDFNVAPAPTVPSPRYFLRCDVTDETGTMAGLRVAGTFLGNNFGPAVTGVTPWP